MHWIYKLMALMFLVLGFFAVAASRSDIQIIIAVVCFGNAGIIAALSTILNAIQRAQGRGLGEIPAARRQPTLE
jgi:multisubunit Na+/H+ antiporter MnhC subunit